MIFPSLRALILIIVIFECLSFQLHVSRGLTSPNKRIQHKYGTEVSSPLFFQPSNSPINDVTFPSTISPSSKSTTSTTTSLSMAKDDELIRRTRSQRQAGAGDRVVELKRPLGVVLEEDEK